MIRKTAALEALRLFRMMRRAWAHRHRNLLRRMLGWPLLHSWARCVIKKYFVHTQVDCLLCSAQNTLRLLSKHSPMMGNDRRMFCRKCGLPSAMWTGKCSGKRPPIAPKPQPLFMHIPID